MQLVPSSKKMTKISVEGPLWWLPTVTSPQPWLHSYWCWGMAVFTCNTVFNNRRHHSHLHSLYINAGLNLWASALLQLLIWSTVPFIGHHNGPSAHIPPPAFSSVRKITYLWRHVISSYLHQTQNFSVQSLFLLFGSSILNILSPPIYLLSLLWTCLNYLSLAFLIFSLNCSICPTWWSPSVKILHAATG